MPARWPLAIAAALVLAAGLAGPALASPCPPPDSEVRCPNTETCIRVDRKVCPSRPRRPTMTIKRACCKDAQGRIRCNHFEHCPSRSPS
jgi:hypothetical protein